MHRKNVVILLVAKKSASIASLSEALGDNNRLINCETFAEAESYIKNQSVDLIIATVDNSGSAESDRIRALGSVKPTLPLILITDSENIAIKSDEQVSGVISGPFRIGRIEEMISGIFSEREKKEALSGRKALLVVDDDDIFRTVLVRTLKLSGYYVQGAADGKMALELIEKGGIDTVIADINMPHMDGLSLLNNIKRNYPTIPVILITGYLASNQIDLDNQFQPDGFMMKPFKVGGIIELLESIPKSGD